MDESAIFEFNMARPDHHWDAELNSETIILQPGDFYVTDKDEVISTTLGSCIAACVRDRELGVGGMNHFMLPALDVNDDSDWEFTAVNTAARYGAFAMERLINTILKKGGKRNNLEFKFFGGGNMLNSSTSIGENNIRFVKEYMEAEGYGIAAQCLGRPYPIKLHYFASTGVAKVRKLASAAVSVVSSENRYANELERKLGNYYFELFKDSPFSNRG
jgi:chemotaxis protein CheD